MMKEMVEEFKSREKECSEYIQKIKQKDAIIKEFKV